MVVRRGRMAPRLGDRVDDTQPRARFWPLERLAAEVAVDPSITKRLETQ
jgi:hypothetical protein